jgi:hypothetical protein
MLPQFDICVAWTWEDVSSCTKQHTFCRSHGDLLKELWNNDDFAAVASCEDEDYTAIPHAIKRVIESGETGKTMFRHAWKQVAVALFRTDVSHKLQDLIHNDFTEDEVSSFKDLMRKQASNVEKVLHPAVYKGGAEVEFLGELCKEVLVESVNDEWELRLWAATKSVGINTGAIKKLPWEALIFTGPIKDLPTVCPIPVSLLNEVAPGRDSLQDLFADAPLTMAGYKDKVNKRYKKLRKVDRSIELEVAFLMERAEPMLRAKLHHDVLAELPGPGKELKIIEASDGLEK